MTLKISRTSILVIWLCFAASPGLAVEPWQGIWAAELDWCRYASEIGTHDPAPVRITPTQIEGLENSCQITQATKIDHFDVWVVDLRCFSEGMEYLDRELLLITHEDRLLRYTMDGYAVEMHRCQ